MALSMKVLSMDYLNHGSEFAISADNPSKNINELSIKIIDGGLNDAIEISWNDCSDINWIGNTIIKGVNRIPANTYDGTALKTMSVKNEYSINPLLDPNVQENTLYCYRIFSTFSNSTEVYSGFKNTFFVYVFDDLSEFNVDSVVPAEWVLQNSTHRFVTDEQIIKWNEINLENYYTKTETEIQINERIQTIPVVDLSGYYNKHQTDSEINKAFLNVPEVYLKEKYYTITETDDKIAQAFSTIGSPDLKDYYTKTEVNSAITSSEFKIGSKTVSEADIANGRYLMYNSELGKIVYASAPSGGGSGGSSGDIVYDGGEF